MSGVAVARRRAATPHRRGGRARGAGPAAALAAALLLAPLARAAQAQNDTAATAPPAAVPGSARPDVTPAGIKWGKWAAAALAVGATAVGLHQHNAGNDAYAALVGYCGRVPCTIAPDGHYADSRAEGIYQQVVRDDRSARVWIVAGQLAAVGSAVLFVLELRHHNEPPNIPYAGLIVESRQGVTRVGYRVGIGRW